MRFWQWFQNAFSRLLGRQTDPEPPEEPKERSWRTTEPRMTAVERKKKRKAKRRRQMARKSRQINRRKKR